MPEDCLTKSCLECGWHVIVGKKLDCNYMNRLGISKPTMGTFIDTETDEEKLKRYIAETEKRAKEAKEKLEEMKKVEEEHGEKKNQEEKRR